MDLEPGRCRRTDGKKWRCSRNVLLDQKYCERHMHRGRQRSRKHVEVTDKFSNSGAAKIVISKKNTTILNHHITTKASSNSVTTPSSNTSHKVCSAAKTVSTTSSNHNIRNNGNLNLMTNFSAESTYITTYDGNNDAFNLKKSRKSILSNSTAATVAPKSDVPPKSALRRGVGCGTSSRALSESGPQRCKRTDGRKWRCSSHVLPEQKYCGQHLHRGVKKLLPASDSVTVALSPPPLAIPKKINNGINLNSGLSVSPGISSDENSSTSGSSSSDATTITDENTSDTSKYIVRARISNV